MGFSTGRRVRHSLPKGPATKLSPRINASSTSRTRRGFRIPRPGIGPGLWIPLSELSPEKFRGDAAFTRRVESRRTR